MRIKIETAEIWLEIQGDEVTLQVNGVESRVESREDAVRLVLGSRGRDLWSGDGRPREKAGKTKRKGRTVEPLALPSPEVREIPKKKRGCQTRGSREKLSKSLLRFHDKRRREEMKILRQVGESIRPRMIQVKSKELN